uniref:DEAD/SNF2-like helicase n=1 Tax=Marseillevirus LCMAC101 TaxID=2506602 RepID=A0A481YTF2_9VIRU|nr:MAG: DEAD/SNF2-like helicase [Marseillevirus LCMAC101]
MSKTSLSGIARFIPQYPNREDEDLSYLLARKKEFNELQLGPAIETNHIKGTAYKHQLLNVRFISPHTAYDSVLVFYDPGLGKCILPQTTILTRQGSFSIEELWDKYNSDVIVCDLDGGRWSKPRKQIDVLSYNKAGKVIPGSIDQLYRQYIEEDILHIKLDNGAGVSITKAHHLYNGEKWTNNFSEGMKIYVLPPNKKFSDKHKLDSSKIKSIRVEHYSGWVYDLKILKHHNYIANNILCHNTCIGSYIVEQFKNVPVDGKPRKPALVIVPNKKIKDIWESEIVKTCTQDLYEPDYTEEEQTERTRGIRTRKKIGKTYSLDTQSDFLKGLPKNPKIIRQDYSNRIIIIDEAHTLKVQVGKDGKEKVNIKRYLRFNKFFHTVENCRIVLLTATPIWDKTHEIASLMNLIIPEVNQLPTGKKFMNEFFTPDGKLKPGPTLDKLKRIFRGRISYLRIKLPFDITEMGSSEPWLEHIKVYPDAMSQLQADAAKRAEENVTSRETVIKSKGVPILYEYDWDKFEFIRDENNELIPDDDGKPFKVPQKIKGGSLKNTSRQACILVAPIINKRKIEGVTFNEKYFESYFKDKKPRYSFGNTPKDKILKEVFKNRLYTYSTKYASIIQLLKDNPKENAYIYNTYVTDIGGVLPFAMILTLHGFEWVTSLGGMKKSSSTKRFMVISAKTETSPAHTAKMIDSFNNKDNKYGNNEYGQRCQIIVGSRTSGLGLTFKNIRQVHFVSPWWNIPSQIQAFGRGYRLTSHEQLPEGDRYINLYRHVAVDQAKKKNGVRLNEGFPSGVYFSRSDDPIDIYMYRFSQQKEFSNSEIYRFMKEMAWDCPLSYLRNVLATDEDGSRQCDYRECAYDCDGFEPFDFQKRINKMSSRRLHKISKKYGIPTGQKTIAELKENITQAWKYRIPGGEIERDTYDLYYSSDEIASLVEQVLKCFQSYFTLSLEALMRFIPVEEEEKESLLQALDHIIDSRILINDRYGFSSYLQEQNNIYFLNTNTSITASYPDANYTSNPLVTERISLGNIVKGMYFEEDEKIVNRFCKRPKKREALLDKLRCQTLIILLEAVYVLKKEKEGGKKLKPREKEVIKVMNSYMNKFLIPICDEDKDHGDTVHVLYQADVENPKCDISNKALKANGSMRIYDEGLSKWRFLDDHDKEEEYINIIKKEKKKTVTHDFKGNPYDMYGFTDPNDNEFKIRIKPLHGVTQTGRMCRTIGKPDLLKYFFDLEYFPKGDNEDSRRNCLNRIRTSQYFSKLEERGIVLSNKVMKKFSTEKIQGIDFLFHRPIVPPKGKPPAGDDLCSLLKEWFESHYDDNGKSLYKG